MSRKLIVCLDGTGNEIEKVESNILRLYKCLKHDDQQLVYYEPGVGTLSTRPFSKPLFSGLRRALGQSIGMGLERNVLHAYEFLCKTHKDGDRLYFFGYSRGAYTARVLAGFINDFGLVDPHELHLIGPVFQAWRKLRHDSPSRDYAPLRISEQFFHVRHPSIRFLGLWDTVSSMLRLRPQKGTLLEFGSHSSVNVNPSVQSVRHVLAVDERRRFFRHQFWAEGQDYLGARSRSKTNPSANKSTLTNPSKQDVKQVWFPGSHGAVGGGVPEKDAGLTKVTLQWMRQELDALGPDSLVFRDKFYKRYVLGVKDKVTEKMGLDIAAPDASAPLYDALASDSPWWLLEILPRLASRSRHPNQKSWLGYYIPLGQPRYIPDGAILHPSVRQRTEDPEARYAPSNLPKYPAPYLPPAMVETTGPTEGETSGETSGEI